MTSSFLKCCVTVIVFISLLEQIKSEETVTVKLTKEEEKALQSLSAVIAFTETIPDEKELKEAEELLKEKMVSEMKEVITEETIALEEMEKELETESPEENESPEEAKTSDKAESTEKSPEEKLPEKEEEEKSEIETSTSTPLVEETSIVKEEAPESTFAVWNSKGKICQLAKFQAVFSIKYMGKDGEQKAEISAPENGNAKGKCATSSQIPLLQVSWQKYIFSIMFNRSEEENWIVSSMELTYDTSETLFDGATSVGRKTARSKDLSLFETPFGKSHFCPGQEVVLMYTGNKQAVTARLKEVYLQPYDVEDGKFSTAHRCSKVVIDVDETFVQDETIPLAVGCTLALITLFILVGFSVHRAYNAAKLEYKDMDG